MNPFLSSELATQRERTLRSQSRRRRHVRRDETLFRTSRSSDVS